MIIKSVLTWSYMNLRIPKKNGYQEGSKKHAKLKDLYSFRAAKNFVVRSLVYSRHKEQWYEAHESSEIVENP